MAAIAGCRCWLWRVEWMLAQHPFSSRPPSQQNPDFSGAPHSLNSRIGFIVRPHPFRDSSFGNQCVNHVGPASSEAKCARTSGTVFSPKKATGRCPGSFFLPRWLCNCVRPGAAAALVLSLPEDAAEPPRRKAEAGSCSKPEPGLTQPAGPSTGFPRVSQASHGVSQSELQFLLLAAEIP